MINLLVDIMKKRGNNLLYWKPRVLALIYIIILSLFSLEVFRFNYTLSEFVTAFFLSLSPALVIGFFLVIAWRMEELGGSLFILLGIILFLRYSRSQSYLTNFLIAAPLILIGMLFIVNSLMGNKHKHLKEKLMRMERKVEKEIRIVEGKVIGKKPHKEDVKAGQAKKPSRKKASKRVPTKKRTAKKKKTRKKVRKKASRKR